MPTPPLFQFFLKKNDTTYYAVVDGVVIETSDPKPLSASPDGWTDTEIKWTRNITYHGIFSTLSQPYAFVKDGAQILRKVYYTEGVEGNCILLVNIRKNEDWAYEKFFEGPIDFSLTVDTETSFRVAVIDNDVEAQIFAKNNTPYEIDMEAADNMLCDGVILEGTYYYVPMETINSLNAAAPICINTTQEGDFPVANFGTQNYLNMNMYLDVVGTILDVGKYNDLNYMLEAKQDMSISLSIDQRIREVMVPVVPGTPPEMKWYVKLLIIDTNREIIVADEFWNDIQMGAVDGIVRATAQSAYYSITAGQRVCCSFGFIYVGGGDYHSVSATWLDNPTDALSPDRSINKIYARFRLQPSIIKAYRYPIAFSELMRKLLNSNTPVGVSTFLNSPYSYYDNYPQSTMVTCGDAIRGLPSSRARWTLNDMFKDAGMRWQLGLGINTSRQVIMEQLSYFYRKNNIIAYIGEATSMEITPADSYLCTQFKIGQNNQDYDDLNGRDEFNTTQVWKNPIIRETEEYDMVTPWRHDMYGVEFTRANLSNKTTTDSSSDNDTFVLSCHDTTTIGIQTVFLLHRPPPGNVLGLLYGDTAFNVDLSPKRDLLRNGQRIATMNHLRNGEKITFQTTDKNADMQSRFNSSDPFIVEKADVPVNSLPEPLWLPILFEFESYVPVNLPQLMAANPYGCFQFTYKGNTYKGFPMEVAVKPARNSTYRYKLLATPDNDLSKLYA